jgi:NAD(P)-dependent dehydrogenase (short-subunit alcohol dehydrogenase family)
MRTPALFDLRGRSALVTGGGRGIGRHLAIGLAEAGAHVFIASRRLENCRETAEAIVADGGQATALEADVSKPESIDALVAAVLAATPRLDVLVNNAGRVFAAPILDYPLDGWDRVFDLNVRGVFYLSQQVARHMRVDGVEGHAREAEAVVPAPVAAGRISHGRRDKARGARHGRRHAVPAHIDRATVAQRGVDRAVGLE